MESRTSKLPLWRTVKSAYRLTWNNRMEYIKISRWWLMLAIPIVYVYNWSVWTSLGPSLCMVTIDANSKQHIPPSRYDDFITLPSDLFVLLFGASIAVAWHRLILRNERITASRYLRFDNVVWGYFIFGFCIYFIPQLPTFAISDTNPTGFSVLKMMVLVIAIIYISVRLSVILPAKALAVAEVTIKDVWVRTRSNTWRLCIGDMLCTFPVILLNLIIGITIQPGCYNDLTGVTLYTLSMLFYIIIAGTIELTFLSLSYQHFFEKH